MCGVVYAVYICSLALCVCGVLYVVLYMLCYMCYECYYICGSVSMVVCMVECVCVFYVVLQYCICCVL